MSSLHKSGNGWREEEEDEEEEGGRGERRLQLLTSLAQVLRKEWRVEELVRNCNREPSPVAGPELQLHYTRSMPGHVRPWTSGRGGT